MSSNEEDFDRTKMVRNMQFLRVQREDEEDTWISGEELKTEGSSESELDSENSRNKVISRKSRRKRSESYTLSNAETARFSLPNLAGGNAKIGFSLTKPDSLVASSSSERFSIASGEINKPEMEDFMYAGSGLDEGMRAQNSLDLSCEQVEDCAQEEFRWRPKRGSLKLPNLDEARFSCEIPKNLMSSSSSCLPNLREKSMKFENLGNDEFEKKTKLRLPNFESGDASVTDASVNKFVDEMNVFYTDMKEKLKLLKNSSVLNKNEHRHAVEGVYPEENLEFQFGQKMEKYMTMPKMKNTLSFISKMDSEITQTMSKFKKERAERLDLQREMLRKIPKNRDSEFFKQLCEFEMSSEKSQHKNRSENQQKEGVGKKSNKNKKSKNFIEQNIELAKLGMNFSLTDEQKQRLEKILIDEARGIQNARDENIFLENPYENCTLNAFRLSDEHKEKILEINKSLEVESKDSEIGVNLVKSLKEIDEKLQELNEAYKKNDENLSRLRSRKNIRTILKIEKDMQSKNQNQN